MEQGPEYIKEIESYFLKLAGEGIMLSSADYSLIQDWKKRDIPKEVVFKGINKAFTEKGGGKKNGSECPRSLRHCARDVEKCIEEYGPLIKAERSDRRKENEPRGTDRDSAHRIERFIHEEKNPALRDYYLQLRKKILALDKPDGDDSLFLISEIEKETLESFFNGLPEKERVKIGLEAENMIKGRARFMTKSAYDESLISFRNEILGRKYGIKCIIS